MASMSMTASLLPSSSSTLTRLPSTTARRGLIVAKATRGEGGKASLEVKQESSNGRREVIFAAAAAAAMSIANVAMGEEPKNGTEEAKKKYAPICVTMPTARVCRK
ncbi:hypothetical protein COLO4_06120 [Corchorus olitorius]|uniref:Photosystem II 5 kDa protein, chloroplastic n=1 Tax=Corchorus olitorius TaxID=93759 RepID=A0A1R3KNX0_9ROSI|nr:hypothetical protein COLO4_06120 [Corchorus olitorius]